MSGLGLTGIGRSGGTGKVPEILGLGFREKLELNDENSILKLNSVRINLANFGMLHVLSTTSTRFIKHDVELDVSKVLVYK